MRFLLGLILMAALVLGVILLTRQGSTGGNAGGNTSTSASPTAGNPESDATYVTKTNVGKAYFENREFSRAAEVFAEALQRAPEYPPALRNLGRAKLRAGDVAGAVTPLLEADAAQPDQVSNHYLLGITYRNLGRLDDALPHLEKAVELDDDVPALHMQLAKTYTDLGRPDDAFPHLLDIVRLDPLHQSGHYMLYSAARKRGDTDLYNHHFREFMRLKEQFGDADKSAEALETCRYTRIEAVNAPAPLKQPDNVVTFRKSSEDALAARGPAGCLAVMEMTPEGHYVLVTAGGTSPPTLWNATPDGFQPRPVDVDLPDDLAPHTCLPGDFHNDVADKIYDPEKHALQDLLLLTDGPLVLLKRTGPDTFEDATESAGLAGVSASTARWVDFDHDGDLDLATGSDEGMALYENDGEGAFVDATSRAGIPGMGPVRDIATGDIDADTAIDIVVTRKDEPALLLRNQRTGTYAPDDNARPVAWSTLLDDFNNDGRIDVATFGDAVTLDFGNDDHLTVNARAMAPGSIHALDIDNDGQLDLLAAGADGARLLRGERGLRGDKPATAFVDVTDTAALKLDGPFRSVVAADLDADGDTDLLTLADDGRATYLANQGGNRFGQLRVALLPTKTNPSGYGTELEVRAGTFRARRNVTQPGTEIGLGDRSAVDTLQTTWTNGVIDNRIDVSVTENPIRIVEKNVATGSCPFLYAADGSDFRFVTDILGNAPIGLSIQRDVPLPADPDEFVEIGHADQFQPHDGMHTVEITEEFREVAYIDNVRLVAVDHPENIEIHPTDKLMPEPFPPSELQWVTGMTTPTSAVGDDGIDRTEALAAIDDVMAPPGPPLPPHLRGMCHPLSLTLDFGPIDVDQPLVLALTGWIQYGDASTNIALSQTTDIPVIPPQLEAELADGSRTPVDAVVGMPAGKTKTILTDLSGKLPAGTTRLRLTTTFQLTWDRIALFHHAPTEPQHVHTLEPAAADLRWRGFSEIRQRRPLGPTLPDYNLVSEMPPWENTPEGWCTNYGDVLELARERDEKLVVMNAGDALRIHFPADALPPIPDDRTRTFFFYSYGWEKDGDHNVITGHTVAPLPITDNSISSDEKEARQDWQVRFNRRWVPKDRFSRRK